VRTTRLSKPAPFRVDTTALINRVFALCIHLTWSDLTPLAWVSPQPSFETFFGSRCPQSLRTQRTRFGPMDCPFVKGSLLRSRSALWPQALRVTVGTAPCPRLRARYTLSTGGNSPAGSVDVIPTGSTPAQRFGTSAEEAPQVPKPVGTPNPARGRFWAQNGPRAEKGRFWAGGPNLKDFGGPPMTARTPAGRLCSHRSLTVVYRGGPGGPILDPPAPDPPKACFSSGT
jgi:hypothetical protein